MSKINKFTGKTILITSYSFANFGGAELNAVELADQLVKFGMIPTFFSYDTRGDLTRYIENKFGTKVLTDQINKLSENDNDKEIGITVIDINDYDYVWVGGNTLPISIIRQLNYTKKLPKFIFIHMSSLVAFPLDAPLMPTFEKKIASAILSISNEATKKNIHRIFDKNIAVVEWPNPVPTEFKKLKNRAGNLNKIAIISSSHPSKEILEMGESIKKLGVKVNYVGKYSDNEQEVNANFYDQYDLIVGIGKNAKYSMVSGVPIYIYGRFGGCGYLNDDNLEINDNHNYSGRGFSRKDSKAIVDEIISGYKAALSFHELNRAKFIDALSLDILAKKVFDDIEKYPQRLVHFAPRYINWMISMQINIMQRHMRTIWLREAESRIKEQEKIIKLVKEQSQRFKANNYKLEQEITSMKSKITELYNSKSWKITKPLRRLSASLSTFKKSVSKTGSRKQ